MTDTAHTSASRTLREIASWQPVKGSADKLSNSDYVKRLHNKYKR